MSDDTKPEDLDALMSGEPKQRLHPILSDKQVLEARAKAREVIEKERVAAAMKDVERQETDRLRREEGLTTGIGMMDEIVDVTIDLPRSALYIMVNGPRGSLYWHGHTYSVPRHVANSLSENMFRLWRAEDQADGKSIDQMLMRKQDSIINGRTGVISSVH